MGQQVSTIQAGEGTKKARARRRRRNGNNNQAQEYSPFLGDWEWLYRNVRKAHGDLAQILLPLQPNLCFVEAFKHNFETYNPDFDKLVAALFALRLSQIRANVLHTKIAAAELNKEKFCKMFFLRLYEGLLSTQDNVAELAIQGEKFLEISASLFTNLRRYHWFENLSRFTGPSVFHSLFLLRLACNTEPDEEFQEFLDNYIRCMLNNDGGRELMYSRIFLEYIQICLKKREEMGENSRIPAFKYLAEYHAEEVPKEHDQSEKSRAFIKVQRAFKNAEERVGKERVIKAIKVDRDPSNSRGDGGDQDGRMESNGDKNFGTNAFNFTFRCSP